MSGAGRRRQRPARGAPGAALRPLTARRSCYHRRSAAEVRAQGPPGSPPAAAARAHLRAVSLPIREPRDWGQSGRVRRGRRRDAGGDAPRGSAGTSWWRLVPPSNPLYPGPRPPPPLSRLPTSSLAPPTPRRAPPLARFSSAGPAAVPHRAAGSPGAASSAGPRPVPRAAASCAPRRHRLRRHPRLSSSSSLAAAAAAAFASLQPRPKPIPPPPPGPAGRRLRTTRRDGGGGVPPRPGSGGRAARGTRVGGGVPERAGGGVSL